MKADLGDYENPYDVYDEFEAILRDYTGAPFVVLTDSCTHAMELCIRYLKPTEKSITIPHRTYLSVPMMLMKLNYDVHIDSSYNWLYEYQLGETTIWDSARGLGDDMYNSGQYQCLSFGHTKRLEIGHGGAILCDNEQAYQKLKRMAFDGRDLSVSPWDKQVSFELGFHYYMRPVDALKGLRMMNDGELKRRDSQIVSYPDLSDLNFSC